MSYSATASAFGIGFFKLLMMILEGRCQHSRLKLRREVIDDEDWLHTRDIGTWLPGGQLKIIDRNDHLIHNAINLVLDAFILYDLRRTSFIEREERKDKKVGRRT
ncbi:hypothetical protein CTI12_AA209130 [Artemisia annua]|uniref:Uncharacterized protein n=1 Tax=Artemisia annua TaxID=35608 RepID=A0A2U1NY34_ARTAN|nr:hypothetical protein CTI12_AA209130 [Artemisia annua]